MSSYIPSVLRNEHLDGGPVVLWDVRGDNEREYFNLEIYSDENYVEKDKDIDAILNMNTYKCHICNIHVPKEYMDEHIRGDKHKTFLKIVDLALQRAQLQMKSNFIQQKGKIKVMDTYFCDHCTTIVQNVDRDIHMSSDVHHDSSKRDRLLQKLMKIYEEPDQDNDKISSVIDIEQDLTDASATTEIGLEYSTDNGDDDIISAENVDKKDETKGSRNENKNNQSDQLCSKEGTLKIETLATAPNSHIELLCAKESTSKNETLAKAPNYTETLHDLQSFLETASFLHTSISVTADSKDTVCISAPNLRKLRVPLMNFQGYSVTGHTVVCKICNNMKSVDGKKHKWSDAHLKKVMLPLKKGYFRQVNDTLNHCVLCNSLHLTSQIVAHTSSTEHANNLQNYSKAALFQINSSTAHLAVNNHMVCSLDNVHCIICDIQIPKTNGSIKIHAQSSTHANKHTELLKANKIIKKAESGMYNCVVCHKKVWHKHLIVHCKSSQHRKIIACFGKMYSNEIQTTGL